MDRFISRRWLLLPACCVLACSSEANDGIGELGQRSTLITAPSDLVVDGHGPEADALIEHYPLENGIAFHFRFMRGVCSDNACIGGADDGDFCSTNDDCTAGALTFSSGETELFDENGASLGTTPFDAAAFDKATDLDAVGLCNADPTTTCTKPGKDDVASCGGGDPACNARPAGFVPDHANYLFRNPNELVAHNLVPAEVEARICFAEFQTMSGCDLLVVRQTLEEYRVPAGQTYIYPMGTPDTAGERLWNNEAHEFFTHHRPAMNQRHAYDVLSLINDEVGVPTSCVDGNCSGGAKDGDSCATDSDCSDNLNTFVYGEPILAMADGVVVALTQGFPENPEPPAILPGVNDCDVRACGVSNGCSGNDVPTTGNSIFIEHDNGEISMMAHTITGSTDFLSCGSTVTQGQQIGLTGNSGNSSAPHLHYATQRLNEFWDSDNHSFPSYYTNVAFASGPDPTVRRQLDVSLHSFFAFDIWAPQPLLARNADLGSGDVNESEPNDTLADHDALTLPVTVSATLENADVGDLAVRGDGIEDVYRIDLSTSDELRIELDGLGSGQNLDVYALTEDLRVLNETRQGTSPGSSETMCLDLDAGAYYVVVSNVDSSQTGDANYELDIQSDPQTIAAAITNAEDPIEVDGQCLATVTFAVTIHDPCCLDADNLGLDVSAALPTGNAILGEAMVDSIDVIGPRDIEVLGHVDVSALESCPAQVVVSAAAQDCLGNQVTTDAQGTSATAVVVDATPPTVEQSNANLQCISPPNHEYVCFDEADFSPEIHDNCAASPTWKFTACSSDQPDNGAGDGDTVNDCVLGVNAESFCARSERQQNKKAGRHYALDVAATDQCNNVSAATQIGNIYVPHDDNPQLVCVSPP